MRHLSYLCHIFICLRMLQNVPIIYIFIYVKIRKILSLKQKTFLQNKLYPSFFISIYVIIDRLHQLAFKFLYISENQMRLLCKRNNNTQILP